MRSQNHPVTPAIRILREKNISFIPHVYNFEEHGGTKASAAALLVDEHAVIKTLVMQTEARDPLLVLMHGDREVSTKQLARVLNVKYVQPCDEPTAQRITGYQFGGKRGFLVEIDPASLHTALAVSLVSVSIEG